MIKIVNLSKKFGKKLIFENINVNFEKGKIYGISGVNGSGKSVFFKIISGLLKPSSGSVEYDGKFIGKDIDYLPELGYMDNNASFIDDLSGFENLKILAGINKKINADDIEKLMIEFNLDPNSKEKVKNYSLGMYQKLSIIQAIMEKPHIIILDEPFNGIDKKTIGAVKDKILSLKNKDTIIIMTSHILGDINEMADEVYEFDDLTLTKI